MSLLPFSASFTKHDCARRQFRIRVFDPQPHKRFVKQDLLAKAQKYLAQQQSGEPTTYRESVRDRRVPPSYANNNNGRLLSHVTLWRWLSWLGSLKHLVQRATQLVLQKDPHADIHRRNCPVPLAKVCSPQRRQTLEQASMTLQKDGFEALARKPRRDRGKPRKAKPEWIQRAVELKKEQPLRADETINQFLQAQFGQRIPKSTLYRHLKQAGATRLKLGFTATKIRCRWTREQTNALWVGDFEEGPYVLHEDRPVRTHLSAFIDCHSRYVVTARYYFRQTLDILIDTLLRAWAMAAQETRRLRPLSLSAVPRIQHGRQPPDQSRALLSLRTELQPH